MNNTTVYDIRRIAHDLLFNIDDMIDFSESANLASDAEIVQSQRDLIRELALELLVTMGMGD